jgi:hypothetical protein
LLLECIHWFWFTFSAFNKIHQLFLFHPDRNFLTPFRSSFHCPYELPPSPHPIAKGTWDNGEPIHSTLHVFTCILISTFSIAIRACRSCFRSILFPRFICLTAQAKTPASSNLTMMRRRKLDSGTMSVHTKFSALFSDYSLSFLLPTASMPVIRRMFLKWRSSRLSESTTEEEDSLRAITVQMASLNH